MQTRPPDSSHRKLRRRSEILQENLQLIENRKQSHLANRTLAHRFMDVVTCAAGQPWFAVSHVIWFAVWLPVNVGLVPGVRVFDPFPFSFLTLVVSLEAIFLSLAILMSQAREAREIDERAQLDLQINLLAERESTKTLELLRALCRGHALPEADDEELDDLLRPTDADEVMDQLENGETKRATVNP